MLWHWKNDPVKHRDPLLQEKREAAFLQRENRKRTKKKKATDRKERIESFLVKCIEETGHAPSIDLISKTLLIPHHTSNRYVRQLHDDGKIRIVTIGWRRTRIELLI